MAETRITFLILFNYRQILYNNIFSRQYAIIFGECILHMYYIRYHQLDAANYDIVLFIVEKM